MAWSTVFSLYAQGYGYRRIARTLEEIGVWTSRGSVERLVKGRGCYRGRRPMPDGEGVESTFE
jgi:hypothetical protein